MDQKAITLSLSQLLPYGKQLIVLQWPREHGTLKQGSPTAGLWPTSGPWAIRNQAVEVAGGRAYPHLLKQWATACMLHLRRTIPSLPALQVQHHSTPWLLPDMSTYQVSDHDLMHKFKDRRSFWGNMHICEGRIELPRVGTGPQRRPLLSFRYSV